MRISLNLMLKIKKATNSIHYVVVVTIFTVSMFLFNFSLSDVHAETVVQEDTPIAVTTQLISKSIFRENEKASIIIDPHFTDYTTSLILYVSNGDTPETWTYLPETLGFGEFLFSDYFSFGSPTGRYLLVEYVNDGQTFSCYGMPSDDCIANPHFISQFSFEVADNNAIDPIISTLTAPISDTATSSITTVDIDGTSIVITSNATSTVSTETTNTPDSSSATGTEGQTAAVIVSDTNIASITSPMPDETATSTVLETQSATSSVSADTNSNGTTTTTF